LKRSRTARSLSYLLTLYPRVRHVFVAPEALQVDENLLTYLRDHKVRYEQLTQIDEVLEEADAFYMMRIQDEYGETSEDLRHQYEQYYLDTKRVARMKPNACILHPLPRRGELPVEIDRDPRAKYWEAVARGKFIRMALLLHMFGIGDVGRIRAKTY
jgi:aspartate carbamoyltransferase catalytic subunit